MASTSALSSMALALVNSFADEPEENVEQAINALQKLPQLLKAKAAANKMEAKHGLTAAKAIKKQRIKKTKEDRPAVAQPKGPKRPLNSWMAFRNYYNPVLAPHTQKARSKILTTFWKEDLFEGKWSMLAKGYSTLRGNREKAEVPLKDYFERCAPIIGVIPPHQYQRMMGWELGPPAEHDETKLPTIKRVFVPTLESFPKHFTTTVLSVDDLVGHCTATGLIKSDEGVALVAQHGALTMAVQPSVAPAIIDVPDSPTESVGDEQFYANLLAELDATHASERPAGEIALHKAALTLNAATSSPIASVFDPASNFDITFDPAGADPAFADGGLFDSFDMGGAFATNSTNNMQFDFSNFVNDEPTF